MLPSQLGTGSDVLIAYSEWLVWREEQRIALGRVAAFAFLPSSNGFGEVCGRGSEE